ncbi:BREX-2 system adenine-specific DNA-methyltransferase PglX [Actinophytocola glycyrrhizae]|uniref:site-specific DNA-methyltransferase (adenine-specific) n=1 Tax=Actinophytocola glycyrrhizae TaxID=2044873 RepID=A0ABV9RYU0_9PSEU
MIDRASLSRDLKRVVHLVEDDVRERASRHEARSARLKDEYDRAVSSGRTSATWETWRDGQVTQIAVAWVLGTVFVRFAEDNDLIDRPFITGRGERLDEAEDRRSEFFRRHPQLNDRDWLLQAFDHLSASHPALASLFDRRHNPLWMLQPSHGAVRTLLSLWRGRNHDGRPIYDFTDPELNTRFLGDLYQDLSETARKTYALLQTPTFVVDFILDLALEPAVEEFGYDAVRVVDPVCGSGEFAVRAFERLLRKWSVAASGLSPERRVRRALEAVHGVDLNPFAVAISRFRLLMVAMQACGHTTFEAARGHGWKFTIAVGDALLGPVMGDVPPGPSDSQPYAEDLVDYAGILELGSYHAVVGNPPYTTVKDRELNQRYRERYEACVGAYTLSVPFAQQFFRLARPADDEGGGAGYVGQLTANSFMKRQFGRSLIEEFYAKKVTLTHVIDTSGAFIPGHGTPTVVLVGRNRPAPDTEPIFTVLGLRGEPAVPSNSEQGIVWQSIVQNSREPNRVDSWTQSILLDRGRFRKHPWSLASTAAAELVEKMSGGARKLGEYVSRIGYYANTGSDEAFTAPLGSFYRSQVEADGPVIKVITGSEVRDWTATPQSEAFFPRDHHLKPVDLRQYPGHLRRLWPFRTMLSKRPNYSKRLYFEDGRLWYDWHQVTDVKEAHPWSIAFSWVATHNHFALLRERLAPLNSAPVVKLSVEAEQREYVELTALLNTSAACFWLKQHGFGKGQPTVDHTGSGEPWTEMYEFTATQLQELPLPAKLPTKRAEELDRLAQELVMIKPAAGVPTRRSLAADRQRWNDVRSTMMTLQEELDWEVYGYYGLLPNGELLAPPECVPPLNLGERAFEIVLARRIAAGEVATTWFERHGSTPITGLPEHWPETYRDVVERRIAAIQHDASLGILEQPGFKRRWATEGWDKLQQVALHDWLLRRCEAPELWFAHRDGVKCPHPLTIDQLADQLQLDQAVVDVAGIYAPGQDLVEVLSDLIAEEQVPYLAALRYRESGLLKRAQWEEVWALQRQEDEARSNGQEALAVEIHGRTPVPPKYSATDFLKIGYWRHRGKLDVPRERFTCYPDAQSRIDRKTPIGWAGWNHEQQAEVLTSLITSRLKRSDLDADVLVPLLAGLGEVMPWLAQWHPDTARDHAAFLRECMRRLDVTEVDLAAWRPPKLQRGRPRKADSTSPIDG